MSIKIMAEVWDHAPVKGGALLFLLALADAAGDGDRCAWPGVEQLSQRARCDERSAYRHAKELQEKGVLVRLEDDDRPARYSRRGGRETTCWKINEVSEWRDDTLSGVTGVSPQPCHPCHPTPDTSVTRTTTTHQGTVTDKRATFGDAPKAERQAPAERVSRPKRGLRAVPDDGEELAVVGKTEREPEPPAPTDLRKLKPQRTTLSANSLAHRFAKAALEAETIPVAQRDTILKALRNAILKWERQGIALADVSRAMEIFFVAPTTHLLPGKAAWLAFVHHFVALHEKATAPDITNPDYYTDQTPKEKIKWTRDEWLKSQGVL